jgi:hypothetical protein
MTIFCYVFVSSERPDPYVNAICAMIKHHSDIRITFVGISDPHSKRAEEVATKVYRMISELAENRYEGVDPRGNIEVRPIQGCDLYRKAAGILRETKEDVTVPRDELDDRLREFTRRGEAIFDVTALQKNYLVDLVSLLTSRRIGKVCYFNNKKPPTFTEEDLIHALLSDDYDYVDLAQSKNVQKAVNRIGRFSAYRQVTVYTAAAVAIAGIPLMAFGPQSPIFNWIQGMSAVAGVTAGLIQVFNQINQS